MTFLAGPMPEDKHNLESITDYLLSDAMMGIRLNCETNKASGVIRTGVCVCVGGFGQGGG